MREIHGERGEAIELGDDLSEFTPSVGGGQRERGVWRHWLAGCTQAEGRFDVAEGRLRRQGGGDGVPRHAPAGAGPLRLMR